MAQYDELAARLDTNRKEFVSHRYSYQHAIGQQLFFLDFPGFDPRLHRFDAVTETRLDYAFSIGSGDQFNYRASDTLVVTAQRDGDKVTYSAYDASRSSSLIAAVDLPAPGDEQRWWAYAVTGGSVYVVTMEPDGGGTWLNRWTPGGAVEKLFTLEQATGQPTLGLFLDFDVDGDLMLFIEGGRLWRMPISTGRATWTRNATEISGSVGFEEDRVIWEAPGGLYSYVVETHSLTKISEDIQRSTYQLNATYSRVHLYVNDFWRWGDWLVYGGSGGIFAYNLKTGTVAPVLLEPHDGPLRIVYRYPVVLTDGTMFVTGLESTSGSVGADGPIWRVDLREVLE